MVFRNSNITMNFIEKHINQPWNWEDISIHPNLTMEFVEKYPDKPWNWNYIGEHQFNNKYY